MEAKMTLYEFAKQVVSKENPMPEDKFKAKCLELAEKQVYHNRYTMLLCNERKDFTIFSSDKATWFKDILNKVSTDIKEVLEARGQVLLIDEQPNGAYEIWIRDSETNENFAYYLFDYTNGVVEV